MYLIVQRSDNTTYAYFEDRKHFKKMEKDRESDNLTRLNMTCLDEECDLSLQGDNFYIVIPVRKNKVYKARKKLKCVVKG